VQFEVEFVDREVILEVPVEAVGFLDEDDALPVLSHER
jgi:hypothetical protein